MFKARRLEQAPRIYETLAELHREDHYKAVVAEALGVVWDGKKTYEEAH